MLISRIPVHAVFVALYLAALPFQAQTADSQRSHGYELDLSDASVSFSVRILGLFPVQGEFEEIHGNFVFTGNCAMSGVTFLVKAASVNTRNRLRDRVIRSPALLDSERHPYIVFSSSRIVTDAGVPRSILGRLTLNGITRDVDFDIAAPDNDNASTVPRGRYRAYTHISRTAFDISAPIPGISDTIDIKVDIDIRPEAVVLATAERRKASP